MIGCWRCIDTIWEAIVVVLSVVDIVTDVLVTIQFYQDDRLEYFYISLAIFILAQCSYALLFAVSFVDSDDKDWRLSHSVVCFFAVFPIAQLVPFFTWLEAFHFYQLDMILRSCGLKPSGDAKKKMLGPREKTLHCGVTFNVNTRPMQALWLRPLLRPCLNVYSSSLLSWPPSKPRHLTYYLWAYLF